MFRSVPFFLGLAVAFVGLSYFLYIPLNDGIGDQSHVRMFLLMCRAMKNAGMVGEMIGWDTFLNMTRRMSSRFVGDGLPPNIDGLKTEDFTFDGIPVRLYRPDSAKVPSPCIIYIHGGGWALLNVDIYDDVVSEFAIKTGYIFVSIDYRLAPEHPFPIPFEDCHKATQYLIKNAEEYGIDDTRIAIAGDSAGGDLAAAVALKLSEVDDIPQLRFQWLIYPALQAFTFKLPSYITNDNATPYFLQTSDVVHFWCHYLGVTPTSTVVNTFLTNNHLHETLRSSKYAEFVDYTKLLSKQHIPQQSSREPGNEELLKRIENIILNPYFSPLMKSNLSAVPPAFVVTAEYDVLRDDGLLYAERMRRDGVDVEVYNAPKSIHGFMQWSRTMPKYSNTDDVTDMFVYYAKTHF